MAVILNVLRDTLSDVLKIIPFLFITYFFMEWMEEETGNKMEHFLEKHRKTAPLAGALFGLVPECGFSSAASSLYATGVISAGTLIAVYISTSDEMLPVLLSSGARPSQIGSILVVKLIAALTAGYLAEIFSKHEKTHIRTFCREENVDHSHGVFVSALLHTLKITAWLFAITFIINAIMDLGGSDFMKNVVTSHPALVVLTSTLFGMIPSCASSVTLSQLYLAGIIGFPAVCAGLCANAGIGMMILFRVNHNIKDNLRIVSWVWIASAITGFILELLF